jgi:hypothetical protein
MNIVETIKQRYYLLKFDIYLHSHHLEHNHDYLNGGELIVRKNLPNLIVSPKVAQEKTI